MVQTIHSSFHTTQYDLNREYTLRTFCFAFRFHTTQYDLNFATARRNFHPLVRFHTTQYDLNDIKQAMPKMSMRFPYYIVRFKLHFPFFLLRGLRGFHTTQYDLNSGKKIPNSSMISCFHTTQYDLNEEIHEYSNVGENVSILHSTI